MFRKIIHSFVFFVLVSLSVVFADKMMISLILHY